jgi:hypothetical protein
MPGGRRLDHEGVLEIYLKRVLAPSLKPGQVIVMDNLSSQKCSRVRELIEERAAASFSTSTALLTRSQPYRRSVWQAQGAALRRAGVRTREALIEARSVDLSTR